MSDKVYVGRKCATFKDLGEYEPFTGAKVWRDDDVFFFAGDETGRVLTTTHRSANQEMADRILNQIKGYVYRPYEATGVELDPAAELGDAVTICGKYSVIGSMTRYLDAGGLCDIAAKGEKEMDSAFPFVSPQDRELKRRVKLGQNYFGTKITRREGLVIERTDGETVTAKVVLNADEMSFYDGDGNRVLFFDPTTGTYKFTGVLNVSDNFVVDKNGNVTMNGAINLAQGSTWMQTRYSTNKNASVPDGWTETWNTAWDNTTTQVWAIYSTNSGNTWTQPMLIQGKDGTQGPSGPQGSDADIPSWVKAYTQSAQFDTLVTNEWVVAMNLFGSRIFGTEIIGGKITSETDIDVTRDVRVGRTLYLGDLDDDSVKTLKFSGRASISTWGTGFELGSLMLSCNHLNLSRITQIDWGKNAPVAVFG